jgi:predicted ATP-grasp superfamily ATP-dependent carboligase
MISSKKKLPVIVMRSNDLSFLGIIRSLGREKIPFRSIVFTWKKANTWFSEKSKYFKKNYSIPNPQENNETALVEMVKIGQLLLKEFKQPLLIIPSSDTNLMFLINNEDTLNKFFVLNGCKKFKNYRADVADKFHCSSLITKKYPELCPKTFKCESNMEIDLLIKKILYPVIVKPSVKDYSQSFYAKHNGMKALTVTNESELKKILNDGLDARSQLIVQEKIAFDRPEDEIPFYAYVDENSKIIMAATGIKELIQPYPYGTANILRLSWHPELLEIAQKIVEAISWRGLIMIEFIKEKNTNQWKMIEINTRPWLFCDFYSRCNFNFIKLLYLDWTNNIGDFKKVKFPSDSLIKKSPLHFGLLAIYNNMPIKEKKNIFNNLDSIIQYIESFGGTFSLTYYEVGDAQPGIENLKALLKKIDSHISIDKLINTLNDKLTLS